MYSSPNAVIIIIEKSSFDAWSPEQLREVIDKSKAAWHVGFLREISDHLRRLHDKLHEKSLLSIITNILISI